MSPLASVEGEDEMLAQLCANRPWYFRLLGVVYAIDAAIVRAVNW